MSADAERLLSLITGHWVSQSVYAAVRTGIVDALDDQPRSAAEVARAAGCHEAATARLLRYLCGAAFVESDADGRYTATAVANLVRGDNNFRDLVLLYGEEFYRAWGHFDESVRTGGTAFAVEYGMEHFDYFAGRQDVARKFDRAMAACAELIGDQLCESFDFSAVTHIVDVGGGDGSLLKKLLPVAPGAVGIVADRDHVAAQCDQALSGHELAGRITAVATDFFVEVPGDGDVYVLSRVLHDWDDEDCVRLLSVCRKAMPDDAQLLVVERLLPEDGGTSLASVWDMQMLSMTGGRERTRTEYATLLRAAGFALREVRPLALDTFLMIGRSE